MTQAVLAIPDSDIAPVTEGAVVEQSARLKGRISEAAFALEAVTRGWIVIDPGDIDDFDRILKRFNTPALTVQIKRAKLYERDQCYRINASRSGGLGAKKRVLYAPQAFDILAAHLVDVNKWVFYTRAEIGNRTQLVYKRPELRKQATSSRACDARDPDNWSLLDQVAAIRSQESFGLGQPMSYPMSDSPCISQ